MKHIIDIHSDTSMYGPLHFFLHFEADGTAQLLYATEELRLIVCGGENSPFFNRLEERERVLGVYEQIMSNGKRGYRVAETKNILDVMLEAKRLGWLPEAVEDWVGETWAYASDKAYEHQEMLMELTRIKAESGAF